VGKPKYNIEQEIRLYQEIHETYMRLVKYEWRRSVIVKINQVLTDYY
jgi:hypothetical protein